MSADLCSGRNVIRKYNDLNNVSKVYRINISYANMFVFFRNRRVIAV